MDEDTKKRIKEVILFSLSHHRNCNNGHCIKLGPIYLCARCTGMYTGFFAFLISPLLFYEFFLINPYLFITLFAAWMPLDVWYDKIGYSSNVYRRFFSGFLFGYGIGIVLLLNVFMAYLYLGFALAMSIPMLLVMRLTKGGWYIWAT